MTTPKPPRTRKGMKHLPSGRAAAEIKDKVTCSDHSGRDHLDVARNFWLSGSWQQLIELSSDLSRTTPNRGELALLCAAAAFQAGDLHEAQSLLGIATSSEVPSQQVIRILISGASNNLAKAAALLQEQSAPDLFSDAVSIGMPNHAHDANHRARISTQLEQIGLDTFRHTLQCTEDLQPRFGESTRLSTHIRTIADRARYLNKNGEELYQSGNYKFAVEYFSRAVKLTPDNAWYCQNLAEAIARLGFVKGDTWECEHLGRAMDQAGKWDAAVRLYRQALKLDPEVVYIHQQTQTFQLEPAHQGMVKNPIFIVGCGHSGTSILLAILGHHPRLYPIPKESALFLRQDDFIQAAMRKWDQECTNQGKPRWIEKTPPHIFQIQRFLAFRPDAKVIVILRDGRDVVCSLKPRIGYTSIKDRIDRWVYDNLAAQRYLDRPNVTTVKYEDLVEDPTKTLTAICTFMGEKYSPAMLEYHKEQHLWYDNKVSKPESINSHSDHVANRNWQINQPLFDGRGRWKKDMSQAEIETFKNSPAQQLLEQLGYVSNIDW